jgi:hypothetical protein
LPGTAITLGGGFGEGAWRNPNQRTTARYLDFRTEMLLL